MFFFPAVSHRCLGSRQFGNVTFRAQIKVELRCFGVTKKPSPRSIFFLVFHRGGPMAGSEEIGEMTSLSGAVEWIFQTSHGFWADRVTSFRRSIPFHDETFLALFDATWALGGGCTIMAGRRRRERRASSCSGGRNGAIGWGCKVPIVARCFVCFSEMNAKQFQAYSLA